MATRFDSFTGPEMGCLIGALANYEQSQAYVGNICPAHGSAPSRDALVLEAQGATNYTASNYPDLAGMNLGSGGSQGSGPT
jgi:hypothetical protein